ALRSRFIHPRWFSSRRHGNRHSRPDPRRVLPMANGTLPTTRLTLLTQLRKDPSDQAGWDEFVDRYGRHIYRWCRQWKLQDADAEDVTQDILVKLTQKLGAFAYDPSRSFRGWLKTVAHHTWRDFADSL